MSDIFSSLIATMHKGHALGREQAFELVSSLSQNLPKLISLAGFTASSCKPFTCGIINAKSGRCGEDCAFCAQSRYHTTDAPVYGLVSEETLYKHASLLTERHVDRMGIVSSGGSPSARDFEKLCHAAERIIQETGIELCASLGTLTPQQAICLVQAGFTRYHHNLETAASYYPSICTTHGYHVRENTVRLAQEAGLRVCSGGLFGMGETWEHRLELSEALQELHVDAIPINFLIPIVGTRLQDAQGMTAREALMLIAIMRLMHPKRDIVLCGGRGHCLGEWDRSFLFAGANGLMVGDYLTAKGSPFERDMDILTTLGLRNA